MLFIEILLWIINSVSIGILMYLIDKHRWNCGSSILFFDFMCVFVIILNSVYLYSVINQ
jgi:hypothetical protein